MTKHPYWADLRFPYDPKWGWVIKREFMIEWGAKGLDLLKGRTGS